ncbi:hypothetical protein [Pseudomonas sp. NA-150]|uniref:hypothetical protein n=1 Tax=Pseudomonas sp. NA-150 TaxID=3367525 RepID=UPI0037C5DBF1
MIAQARVADGDSQGARDYLSPERMSELRRKYPISKDNFQIYNLIAAFLFDVGEVGRAYELVKGIDEVVPDSKVATLKLADESWETDRAAGGDY